MKSSYKMEESMNTRILGRLTPLLLAMALAQLAQAQPTTFNYQGQLLDRTNGTPLTGSFDMLFYLRDGATGEGSIGPTNVFDGATPITVDKGVFQATLDFGAAPFSGARRWLQIEVRTHGVGAYERMADRAEITSVPYAITAANVTGGGLSAGTYNNALTFNNPANSFTGNGGGLTGLNASNVSSGALADARLSPNVALLNRTLQTFMGDNSFANVTVNPPSALSFGAATRQMINLWGTQYGLGVQTSTHYFRADTGASFAWYEGGVHSDSSQDPGPGGTTLMTLGPSGGLHLAPSASSFKGLAIDDMWLLSRSPSDTANSYFLRARHAVELRDGQILMNPDFLVRSDGNIGIGTAEPLANLHVVSRRSSAIDNTATFMNPALGPDASHVHFGANGDWYIRSATNNGKVVLQDTGGRVGIGTANPAATLNVVSARTTSFENTGTFYNPALGPHASHIHWGLNGDWYIRSASGAGNVVLQDTGGKVGIGTSDPQFPLDVAGLTRTCVLQIKGGCDIAEPFEMSDGEIPKGSLVIIDEENPGKLKLAAEEYDTRAAGIVSGANGVNSGISLHQEGVMDAGQNVALSGRVYALADAAYGAIKPGDLLTSSGTPGHVRRVADHSRAQGAIVGKAMSGLKEGRGMVLVLVTLQ
jgi:hypothetical protein